MALTDTAHQRRESQEFRQYPKLHRQTIKSMRTFYSLIIVGISIATIVLYTKTPTLSSSNIQYEYTQDRPPVSDAKRTKISTTVQTDDDDAATPFAKNNEIAAAADTPPASKPQDTPKGLHLCTCLNPNMNYPESEIPKRLRWLHFPKTGTSFISTLWSYACSTRERYIDLEISSFQCDIFTRNAFSMYDFALMK